jgi:hypothetical protein
MRHIGRNGRRFERFAADVAPNQQGENLASSKLAVTGAGHPAMGMLC